MANVYPDLTQYLENVGSRGAGASGSFGPEPTPTLPKIPIWIFIIGALILVFSIIKK